MIMLSVLLSGVTTVTLYSVPITTRLCITETCSLYSSQESTTVCDKTSPMSSLTKYSH